MSNIIKIDQNNRKKFVLKFNDEIEDFSNVSISKQDQLNSLLQQQFERGYKEGYETANKDMLKDYNKQLENEKLNFEKFMEHVDKMMLKYDKDFEELVVDLSFKISEKIIRKEIKRESNIEVVLKDSVRKIIGSNNVLIKLNPNDYEKINIENPKNKFMDESLAKVNFQKDERIEPGGCVVETEIGNVDARIDTQLSELKKHFE